MQKILVSFVLALLMVRKKVQKHTLLNKKKLIKDGVLPKITK